MRDDVLKQRIDRIAASEPGYDELGDACHDLLAEALPHEGAVWFALDPATLLPTRFVPRFGKGPIAALQRGMEAAFRPVGLVRRFELKMLRTMIRDELEHDDSLSWGALLRASGHVATLRQVTGGDPSRSARMANHPLRNLLSDELRLMLTDAGEGWGMMMLARRTGVFSPDEVKLATKIGPALGRITRLAFLRSAAAAGDRLADPPGLILFGPEGVEHVSPEAERLVGTPEGGGWDWLAALSALADHPERSSVVLDSPAGPITVHATTFGERASLIVERARPYLVADRLVRAYGLTPRERDVVGGMSKGWSTRRIAFELDLADYTVQDHLRAIFDKVGVRSRKEVLAKLFFEHYLPAQSADSVPSPYGWFLDEG